MADWRERGYVPDSDEEDDFSINNIRVFSRPSSQEYQREVIQPTTSSKIPALTNFDSTRSSIDNTRQNKQDTTKTEQNPPALSANESIVQGPLNPTANELEATINHGLDLIREALSPASISRLEWDDGLDSPLSSALSLIEGAPEDLNNAILERESPGIIDGEPELLDQLSHRFRQRTAVQRNPYSIEGAIYRQQFKDRGLRPVHIRHNSPSTNPQDQDVSQDTDALQAGEANETPGETQTQNESNEDSQSPITASRRRWRNIQDLEDELPDLQDILHNRNEPRRKTKSSNSAADAIAQKRAETFQTYDLPSSAEEDYSPSKRKKGKPLSDRIPSPPPSSGNSSLSLSHLDVGKQVKTPAPLITPLLSSETRNLKRTSSAISHESIPSSSDSSSDEALISSPKDGVRHLHGLQRMKKRIKGVLPASWLRLDMARKVPSKSREITNATSPNKSPEKGLAKRVRARRPLEQPLTHDNAIFDLETSDSDGSVRSIAHPALHETPSFVDKAAWNYDQSGIVFDEALEENVIDPMFSPQEPMKKASSLQKQRSKSSWIEKSAVQGSISGSKKVRSTTRGSSKQKKPQAERHMERKRSKRSHEIPQFDVLNAPDLLHSSRDHQPAFLRLAARQAKRPRRRGKPTVVRKILVFTDDEREDDLDHAVGSSVSYQRGNFKDSMQTPQLMTAVNKNERLRRTSTANAVTKPKTLGLFPDDFTQEMQNLKQSTHLLLRRIQNRPYRNNVEQSSDIKTAKSNVRSENLGRLHLKSLLPRHNRSGPGVLITKPSNPRPAQLEIPLVEQLSQTRYRPISSKSQRKIANDGLQQSRNGDGKLQTNWASPYPERAPTNSSIQPSMKRKQTPRLRTAHQTTISDIPKSTTRRHLVPRLNSQYGHFSQNENDQLTHNVVEILENWSGIALFASFSTPTIADDLCCFPIRISEPIECQDELGNPCTKISAPKAHTQHVLGFWNESSEQSSKVVWCHIREVLCDRNRTLADVDDCIVALDTLTHYVDHVITFRSGEAAREFANTTLSELVVTSLAFDEMIFANTTEVGNRQLQKFATRLCSLGYKAYHMSLEAGLTSSSESLTQLIQVTSPLTLLWLNVDSLATALANPGSSRSKSDLATLEGFGILEHIYYQLLPADRDNYFWTAAKNVLNRVHNNPYSAYAHVLLIAALFGSLITSNLTGNLDLPRHSASPNYQPAWNILLQHLKAFNGLHKSQCQESDNMRRLRAAGYQLFLSLCTTYKWPLPQGLFENWFHDHEKVWFQSVTHNSTTRLDAQQQKSFTDFLYLLKVHLSVIRYNEEPSMLRQTQALIYKLIPNRGEIGVGEDVGAMQRDLRNDDLLPIKNLFALYVLLVSAAPLETGIRISPLAAKVNFASAHDSICAIALDAWKTLANEFNNRTNTPSRYEELSAWLYSMIEQIHARFVAAEEQYQIALASLSVHNSINSSRLFEARRRHAQEITFFNQQNTCRLLDTTLEALLGVFPSNADRADVAEEKARQLIGTGKVWTLLKIMVNPLTATTNTRRIVLQIIDTYAKLTLVSENHKSLAQECLNGMKQLLRVLLGEDGQCEADVTVCVLRTWFAIATSLVKSKHKSWDDFILPQSSLALDLFVSSSNLLGAKTVFFHLLICEDHEFFQLELRPLIFSHWIISLLQPQEQLLYEHLLTHSIFHYEHQSLLMDDLSGQFRGQSQLSIQDIIEFRTDIVRHIIRYIHCQRDQIEEADWLPGGLDSADCIRLLRTIIDTMKDTFLSIRHNAASAYSYSLLITEVLEEFRRYPSHGLYIDFGWFASQLKNHLPEHPVYQATSPLQEWILPEDASRQQIDQITDAFCRVMKVASISNKIPELSLNICTGLLPMDPQSSVVRVTGTMAQLLVDVKGHARFIAAVFPLMLSHAPRPLLPDFITTANAICNIIQTVLQNFHLMLRVESSNEQDAGINHGGNKELKNEYENARTVILATFPVVSVIREILVVRGGTANSSLDVRFVRVAGSVLVRTMDVWNELGDEFHGRSVEALVEDVQAIWAWALAQDINHDNEDEIYERSTDYSGGEIAKAATDMAEVVFGEVYY